MFSERQRYGTVAGKYMALRNALFFFSWGSDTIQFMCKTIKNPREGHGSYREGSLSPVQKESTSKTLLVFVLEFVEGT